MGKKKEIQPFYVINWDTNSNELEYYNVMPYFVDCWNEDKKRRHKIWARSNDNEYDDTKMPETFEEFKAFIEGYAFHRFWSRCEYEVIVSAWPPHPKRNEDGSIKTYEYDVYFPEKHTISTIDFCEHKIDIYQQIMVNIDVVTKLFMDYITNGKELK